MNAAHRFRALTTNLIQARFVDRPNRYVVTCRLAAGGLVHAHLANPGRLWELLLPDVRLWLSPVAGSDAGAPIARKTQHTVVAIERDRRPVFVQTHVSNDVAELLLRKRRIPSLAHLEVVDREVRHGRSRFDFMVSDGEQRVALEVKSVTLFGNGMAMFPDAPTTRGRRHLLELADMSKPAARPVVLFLVHAAGVTRFLPEYHRDPAFSRTLVQVRHRLQVVAAAIGWRPAMGLPRRVTELSIDWQRLQTEAQDRGAYLLLLHLRRSRRIAVGALGHLRFARGYYVYVGSAMKQLSARIARHLRKRKKHHWHVDYLRDVADTVRALPIRSSRRIECRLAQQLRAVLTPGPRGFGCSDCDCPTHLFTSETNPLQRPEFHRLLEAFRMPRAD